MSKILILFGQVIYIGFIVILLLPIDWPFNYMIKFTSIVVLVFMLPFFILSLYWKKYNLDWQEFDD